MPVTTVITHLSNDYGWVPPIPPTPPAEDTIFFENGVFNSNLVADGFDFNNNFEVFTDQEEIQSLLSEGTYKQYADNGTIAKIKYSDPSSSDDCNLSNNKIRYQHFYDDEGTPRYVGESILIPIKNWILPPSSYYSFLNFEISINCDSEGISGNDIALYYGRYNESTHSYIFSREAGYVSPCPIDSIIISLIIPPLNQPYAIDILCIENARAASIERNYNFEISKIWVTNNSLPPQSFWINSPGASPIQLISGNYPYLVSDAENEHLYNIVGDFQGVSGSDNVGIINTIKIEMNRYTGYYGSDGMEMVPFNDANEQLAGGIQYGWSIHRDWDSDQEIYIYKIQGGLRADSSLIASWDLTPLGDENDKINVYIYGGADTFPLQNGTQTPVLYFGMAYIDENNIVHHKGAAIDLDYYEQTYEVHLPAEWLTPAN